MDDSKARTPRRVKIALIASLAVNVLVIGAIIGAMSHGSDRGPRKNRGGGQENAAIGIYGRALDKTDRRAIGDALRNGQSANSREIRAELGELALHASELLTQSPFDKTAFSDLLQQQQGLIKGRSDAMQGVLVEHIATMSDEQRTAYAKRLQNALERGARRNKPDRK